MFFLHEVILELIVGVNCLEHNYIIVGEAIINDFYVNVIFIFTIVNIQLFQSHTMNPWYLHFCEFIILQVVILSSNFKCPTIFVQQLAMCESFGGKSFNFLRE